MTYAESHFDPLVSLQENHPTKADVAPIHPSKALRSVNEWMSFEGIRHFFEDCNFDLYSKEYIGPESYRVAGEPCHGGYGFEQQKPDD